jgi:hypothetical protein
MTRFMIFLYGLLAALCWLACIGIMIWQPFLSSTNGRAIGGFTIMGIIMTGIWLFIIYSSIPPKPLSYGKR